MYCGQTTEYCKKLPYDRGNMRQRLAKDKDTPRNAVIGQQHLVAAAVTAPIGMR